MRKWSLNPKWIGWVLNLMVALILGGCNLPGQPTPETPSPDLIYTAAAKTIIAKVTESALQQPAVGIPGETATTQPEPTWTPSSTSTATHTLTPTETPTLTPIPNAILEDNFSNESLWYVTHEKNYGFEYQDGGYRIYNQILNGAIWSVRNFEYKDIRIEADAVRMAGPEDGYFGVACRLQNDGEDYYALVIGDNGFFGILKMIAGESEFLEYGIDQQNVIRRGLGNTNRVAGVCSGSQLVLFANGQKLAETSDENLIAGQLGLVVGNRLSGIGIDVLFDNFALVWP